MKRIKLREFLMLTVAGCMVTISFTVLIRLGTHKLLVQKLHIDNAITQSILTGTGYGIPQQYRAAKEKKIDYQKRYPFESANIEGAVDVHGGGQKYA